MSERAAFCLPAAPVKSVARGKGASNDKQAEHV